MNIKKKKTVCSFRKMKQDGEKIVAVTAYDAPTARLANEAGADFLLIGDSMANTVLGYENTLPLTIEESLFHCKAARRGAAPEQIKIRGINATHPRNPIPNGGKLSIIKMPESTAAAMGKNFFIGEIRGVTSRAIERKEQTASCFERRNAAIRPEDSVPFPALRFFHATA